MPLKSRSHYLIFIMSWVVAFVTCLIVAQENGFHISNETIFVVILFLSIFPAALGYLAISKFASLYDNWRYRSGRDIYREDQYEDDAGFIHLNQTSARINKHETDLADVIGDAKSVLSAVSENSNEDY